jgi:hypothetical protein
VRTFAVCVWADVKEANSCHRRRGTCVCACVCV